MSSYKEYGVRDLSYSRKIGVFKVIQDVEYNPEYLNPHDIEMDGEKLEFFIEFVDNCKIGEGFDLPAPEITADMLNDFLMLLLSPSKVVKIENITQTNVLQFISALMEDGFDSIFENQLSQIIFQLSLMPKNIACMELARKLGSLIHKSSSFEQNQLILSAYNFLIDYPCIRPVIHESVSSSIYDILLLPSSATCHEASLDYLCCLFYYLCKDGAITTLNESELSYVAHIVFQFTRGPLSHKAFDAIDQMCGSTFILATLMNLGLETRLDDNVSESSDSMLHLIGRVIEYQGVMNRPCSTASSPALYHRLNAIFDTDKVFLISAACDLVVCLFDTYKAFLRRFKVVSHLFERAFGTNYVCRVVFCSAICKLVEKMDAEEIEELVNSDVVDLLVGVYEEGESDKMHELVRCLVKIAESDRSMVEEVLSFHEDCDLLRELVLKS